MSKDGGPRSPSRAGVQYRAKREGGKEEWSSVVLPGYLMYGTLCIRTEYIFSSSQRRRNWGQINAGSSSKQKGASVACHAHAASV